MVLGQIVALVMVNKHMHFHKICFNTYKVIAKVKVCHNDDYNDYAPTNADDDTRVMTIPRLFPLKNSRANNDVVFPQKNLTLFIETSSERMTLHQ